MRIRKHAKTSPLIYTHVCQLNQSPWDVITFPIEENEDPQTPFLPPSPPPSSSNYQCHGYADNGTFYDSNGTVQSVTSMKVDEMKDVNCLKRDNYLDDSVADEDFPGECDNDVKKIKQDQQEDVHMEELGLSMDGINGDKLCYNKPEKQHEAAVAETGSPLRRPRAKKSSSSSSSSSSNPYEFYYYSGFGPLWGKKRGSSRTDPARSVPGQYSSSQVEDEEFDCIEDEDDREGNGKKRSRKPIKARSLKSLM